MKEVEKKSSPFIILFILIVGLMPVGWYWFMVGCLPAVTAVEALSHLNQPNGETMLVNGRDVIMPLPQQLAAVAAGYVVKPIYMILSVLIVVLLWRLRAGDLAALRWGMIFFFVGEAFCAINYIFFGEGAHWAEYLHSYGMVLAFAFVTYALIEGVDGRIIKLSQQNKRCAFLELCGNCIKYKEVRCGAARLFLWLIPVMVALALIPLTAAPVFTATHTTILGTQYTYRHLVIYQLFEIRFLPILAITLIAPAWVVLWRRRTELLPHTAKLLFAAGLGALGFSFFRMLLIGVYQNDLMWATFWEEVTELMFVTAVIIILWLFRQTWYRERFPKSHLITWRDMLGFNA